MTARRNFKSSERIPGLRNGRKLPLPTPAALRPRNAACPRRRPVDQAQRGGQGLDEYDLAVILAEQVVYEPRDFPVVAGAAQPQAAIDDVIAGLKRLRRLVGVRADILFGNILVFTPHEPAQAVNWDAV